MHKRNVLNILKKNKTGLNLKPELKLQTAVVLSTLLVKIGV